MNAFEKRNYIGVLNFARVICAVWVSLYHLLGGHGWFQSLKFPYPEIIYSQSENPIYSLLRLGFLGVPIFFVISGISIVLSSESKNIQSFTIARLNRLIPTFLISVLITCAVSYYGFKAPYGISFDTLTNTLSLSWEAQHQAPIQGSYWTLWPETVFYFLFAAIVLKDEKVGSEYNSKVLKLSTFWIFSKILILEIDLSAGQTTLFRFSQYFILGCLIGLLAKGHNRFQVFPLLIISFVLSLKDVRYWIISWDKFSGVDLNLGLLIFSGSILIFVFQVLKKKRNRASEYSTLLGKSSYAFYLLQEGLGMPVVSFLFRLGHSVKTATIIAVFLVAVISIYLTIFSDKYFRNRYQEN